MQIDDSPNDQRHVGKYDELQAPNHLTGEPYDKINPKHNIKIK